MAIHNFDYSYAYVGVHTTPLSKDDDTAIVTEITVAVTATDQADNTVTHTENFSKVFSPFAIKDNGIPSDFILIEDLTESQVIDWYKAIQDETSLNDIFTWKIFGPEEVSPIPSN